MVVKYAFMFLRISRAAGGGEVSCAWLNLPSVRHVWGPMCLVTHVACMGQHGCKVRIHVLENQYIRNGFIIVTSAGTLRSCPTRTFKFCRNRI